MSPQQSDEALSGYGEIIQETIASLELMLQQKAPVEDTVTTNGQTSTSPVQPAANSTGTNDFGAAMSKISTNENRTNSLPLKKRKIALLVEAIPACPPVVATPAKRPKRTRRRRRTRKIEYKEGQKAGRWTDAEHELFLQGLKQCGRDWRKVSFLIPTRTASQIRSHAQKYFSKIQLQYEKSVLSRKKQFNQTPTSTSSVVTDPSSEESYDTGSSDDQSIATTENSIEDLSSSPSMQDEIDKIMADPCNVQDEIEMTVKALKERYAQLQQKLITQRKKELGLDLYPGQNKNDTATSSQPLLAPNPEQPQGIPKQFILPKPKSLPTFAERTIQFYINGGTYFPAATVAV